MTKEPVTVLDVAAYILREHGPMSTMKLQKLVYYAQAWSLVWDGKPLFDSGIEAWAHGPVVRDLYSEHRGLFEVTDGDIDGDPDTLSADQKETVDVVLDAYGHLTGQQLSIISHGERPWIEARAGVPEGVASTNLIDLETMQDFYSSQQSAEMV